jgi:hypothetical protein
MNRSPLPLLDRERRVRAVVDAARRLADPGDPLGIEARRALPLATGLSPANVERSLARHLETSVSPDDLERLIARAGTAPRVHVVLSANVFTAVVRAVALAVAAAPVVVVRPSSREGVLAPLLRHALGEQGSDTTFELSTALETVGDTMARSLVEPEAGDLVHVYGRRETIDAIAARCPPGVTVRGHGPGFGIALIGDALAEYAAAELRAEAERLSWDIVAFDQRGCLSPRVALFTGSRDDAERFASFLAAELEQRESEVPRGALSDEERRDRALYRQSLQAVGQCFEGATSLVGLDLEPRALVLPPAGRHLHVMRVRDAGGLEGLLAPHVGAITCFGVAERSSHAKALAVLAPGARSLPIGNMQRPPLDGPVDQREML